MNKEFYNASGCADPTAFEAIRNVTRTEAEPTIRIINLRKEKPRQPWDVRVDRGTVWGNPYYMNGEGQRNEVCDLYEEYFSKRRRDDEAFERQIAELCALYLKHGRLNLFCWCAPKRCHAETIIKALCFK